MKRLLALLLALFLFPVSASCGVIVRPEAKGQDAVALVTDCLFPYLEDNPKAALLFGAELNISNGDPTTRDYGERGMFGKLVSAEYVMENYDDLSIMHETVLEETKRLLLGPWQNDGHTALSFSSRRDARLLDYETGKWSRVKHVPTIRIEHTTEYTGMKRVAHIACELENPDEFGDYVLSFGIVRE